MLLLWFQVLQHLSRFKSKLGKNIGDYGFIRYKIDSKGDFKVVSRNDSEICIEVPFIKKDSLGGDLAKLEKGKVFLNLSDDGKWRISKISNWYDDLSFYELGEYIDYFFDSKNNVKTNYEDFINRISMSLDKDIDRDDILVGSDTGLISQSVNLKKLQKLSKLSAYIACEEIYARHGKIYEEHSPEYYYFHKRPWYKENENFDKENLRDIEKENIKVIKEYINSSF